MSNDERARVGVYKLFSAESNPISPAPLMQSSPPIPKGESCAAELYKKKLVQKTWRCMCERHLWRNHVNEGIGRLAIELL